MVEENYINNIEQDELIRLVSSSADTSNQYVIFRSANDELFALNVAKVEELLMYKDIGAISPTLGGQNFIYGISKIRNSMVTIINFDSWLGLEKDDEKEYKIVILCDYSNKKIGIVIKNVVGIMHIDSSWLQEDTNKDDKTSYVVQMSAINNELCSIFDSDRLMIDTYSIETDSQNDLNNIDFSKHNINRKVLVAEDSDLAQASLSKLLAKMKVNYEMYHNGKDLLDRIYEFSDPNDISLVITDVEMPILDGLALLKTIKEDNATKSIPVIINTNMGNQAISNSANHLGASSVVSKLDLHSLRDAMIEATS
jgi:two-component system chemotaxis response regulator CheV